MEIVVGVLGVLLEAGSHSEDVRVENDVFGWETHFLREEIVRPPRNLDLPIGRVGLALLVECHDDHGGTVPACRTCLLEELAFSLLQGYRVDHTFALQALQSCLDHLPARGIENDRHAGDVGFACNELEEPHHSRLRVEQTFVHVDVDHLRAAGNLLPRNIDRRLVIALSDESGEAGRSGDVGALADVHEERLRSYHQRLQAG